MVRVAALAVAAIQSYDRGMETPMSKLGPMAKDAASMYTTSKGRMPWNVHELREWLREFAEFETKHLQSIADAYFEHVSQCNRPMVFFDRKY